MKRYMIIPALAMAVIFVTCAKDYSRDIIGTWNAGKATLDKDMTVVINGDGTLTAEIKDLSTKPIKGTYHIDKDVVEFKLPSIVLTYRILKLDRKVLVMKWKYARITWNRIQ